jgi:putative NADPH-quinone reductase
VVQHPPLLKLWIDKVFSHGWAYGHNGNALKEKPDVGGHHRRR